MNENVCECVFKSKGERDRERERETERERERGCEGKMTLQLMQRTKTWDFLVQIPLKSTLLLKIMTGQGFQSQGKEIPLALSLSCKWKICVWVCVWERERDSGCAQCV